MPNYITISRLQYVARRCAQIIRLQWVTLHTELPAALRDMKKVAMAIQTRYVLPLPSKRVGSAKDVRVFNG
jgi:hypothetical protein